MMQLGLLLLFFSTISTAFSATFTVTKTTDTYPKGVSGQLRWAIQQSNKASGVSTINFKIPGTGPFTITPVRDLDTITKPVIINGYSQSSSKKNTLAQGNNAKLLIQLSGNNYKTGNAYVGTGNGLYFAKGSDGSSVRGLIINAWINNGIVINAANNISIMGNYLGTTPGGTAQKANQTGIFIESSSSTVVGTNSAADRNIIAGSFFFFNESASIVVNSSSGIILLNYYIGLDKTGSVALGNSLAGITCGNSNNTMIGLNIISGHTIYGVALSAVKGTMIVGNYIGTDVTGTYAVPNGNMGILLNGSGAAMSTSNNVISNNLISGNRIGIKLGLADALGVNQNSIKNNLIGPDITGTKLLGNDYGIVVNDSQNVIGSGNIIAGNTVGGILLYGSAGTNTITNNYIGTNKAGLTGLGNGYGIQLGLLGGFCGAAPTNTIARNTFGGGNSVVTVALN